MDRLDLYEQFSAMRRSLALIFAELPSVTEDYRPRDNMRSAWEVANHLAQIPAIDSAIASQKSQEVVQALEHELACNQPDQLLAVWDHGIEELEAFYDGLTLDAFENSTGKAFYGHEDLYKNWLLSTLTHSHHHRAQLFNYLREMGKPLNGFVYLYA